MSTVIAVLLVLLAVFWDVELTSISYQPARTIRTMMHVVPSVEQSTAHHYPDSDSLGS
jgi:ABC-type polysaccharide/polyol phosphate export permease